MSDAADPRLVAAVRAIVADAGRLVPTSSSTNWMAMAPEIVVARGVERLMAISYIAGDERPAERIRRENASALLEMAALGNGRDAAMRVAGRRSLDPYTRERLAQRFRRLRRTKMKRALRV